MKSQTSKEFFFRRKKCKITLLSTLFFAIVFSAISQDVYVIGEFSYPNYKAAVFRNNTKLYEPIGFGRSIVVSENNDNCLSTIGKLIDY